MLVRLREMELDAIRREVAELNRQVEAVEGKKVELNAQIVSEQVYLTRLEGISTYGAYSNSVYAWQHDLDEQRQGLDEKIDAKSFQIRAAYEALKTAQVALDRALSEVDKTRQKAEQDSLDEAALQQFLRQSEGQP